MEGEQKFFRGNFWNGGSDERNDFLLQISFKKYMNDVMRMEEWSIQKMIIKL